MIIRKEEFIIKILLIVLFISLFILVLSTFKYSEEKILQRKIETYLKQKEIKERSVYTILNEFLRKRGNPLKLTVGSFIIIKIIFAMFIFLMYVSKNIILAVILGIFGFFLLDIAHIISDKSDMNKIKLELSDLYDFIEVQLSAGAFLGNVLVESYQIVKNKRLKKALKELSAEINLTKDIDQSLEKFKSKFNSIDIECLIMAIKQNNSNTSEMLKELSKSLKEEKVSFIKSENNRIKGKILVNQFLIYVGVIITLIYCVFNQISANMHNLFN